MIFDTDIFIWVQNPVIYDQETPSLPQQPLRVI